MKKYTAFVLCLFIATFAINFVSAQTESSPQIRQKTFEKIWQTVNDKYFDANFGGVDWRAAQSRYAPQVAQVKSDAEFYDLMKTMLGELKVSHLEILTPDTRQIKSRRRDDRINLARNRKPSRHHSSIGKIRRCESRFEDGLRYNENKRRSGEKPRRRKAQTLRSAEHDVAPFIFE